VAAERLWLGGVDLMCWELGGLSREDRLGVEGAFDQLGPTPLTPVVHVISVRRTVRVLHVDRSLRARCLFKSWIDLIFMFYQMSGNIHENFKFMNV
jgi:hypothetical protein